MFGDNSLILLPVQLFGRCCLSLKWLVEAGYIKSASMLCDRSNVSLRYDGTLKPNHAIDMATELAKYFTLKACTDIEPAVDAVCSLEMHGRGIARFYLA